jgi:hypothetical protein
MRRFRGKECGVALIIAGKHANKIGERPLRQTKCGENTCVCEQLLWDQEWQIFTNKKKSSPLSSPFA